MEDSTRRLFDTGLVALTVGTSWARIEAGKHYPSDVLFGMALGNFLAVFINDAFLGNSARCPSRWDDRGDTRRNRVAHLIE